MRDLGPVFVFALLWLPWCSAYRPAIDQEGVRSLQLETRQATECPEELLEAYRAQLRGLGLKDDGNQNPCEWKGVTCRECKVLRIRSKEADGDLLHLQNMTDLKELALQGCQVTGDVGNLRKLTQLRDVRMPRTQVFGDAEVFGHMKDLHWLFLAETQVSGDISALQSELWQLDLSGTNISGDVGALQHLTELRQISLDRTKVSGNIGSFSKLVRLDRLPLRETQVSGNLSSLEKLTELQELDLAGTNIFGEIRVIRSMESLERVDISGTKVFGSFKDLQRCCPKLRDLNTAESQFEASWKSRSRSVNGFLLQALQVWNVTGTSLNDTPQELLVPLLASPVGALHASGCGLRGSLGNLLIGVTLYSEARLLKTLQLLDLSENTLDEVSSLPVKLRLDVSNNRQALRISPVVIEQAAQGGIDLWLTNTRLANPQEMRHLLASHLRPTDLWVPRENAGFSCHDLVAPNFRVTPELFMPDDLCACRPGFSGRGTNCAECPSNSFSIAMNQPKCQECPADSASPPGSTSVNACICRFGSVEKVGSDYVCACAKNEAQTSEQRCVSCSELHLVCEKPGELVARARLQPGFIRLQEVSEEIFQCLDEKRCRNSTCTPGHVGPLCADCAASFRAAGGGCIECKNLSSEQKVYTGLGFAAMLLILAALAWNFRHRLPSLSPRQGCLLQLLVAQSAVLLQVVQLWTVLGRLPRALGPGSDVPNVTGIEDGNTSQSDPLLSYLETLQFTGSELQSLLALQCLYDGVTVRMLFALATPLVPLLLLLICAFLEVFSPGFGIRLGLKTLTVLFIGGAAGSAQLLGCQRTDAAGLPLKKFAFRPLFPHKLCDEVPWVDAVGWATAACYGLFIPAFLGFLFMKQNVVMRKTKMLMTQTVGKGRLTVRLQGLQSEKTCEEEVLGKRLAAAAAAYVANHVTGRAVVELQKDAVIVVPSVESAAVSDDLTDFRMVESLVFGGDSEEAQVLQRHATAQMLMERSILEEESDRFMLGASQMFSKYAKCENVWMEVCSKVAAAALVSVVAVDGLWLCVAITLGMALVTSLARPFAQPQLNDLQATGFACLAVAAVGFRHRVLLANLALAAPLVLLVLQLRRPDSVEMLALRLQQELESKIHEGPVEVSAEQFA